MRSALAWSAAGLSFRSRASLFYFVPVTHVKSTLFLPPAYFLNFVKEPLICQGARHTRRLTQLDPA
jgi:hypothetical protein